MAFKLKEWLKDKRWPLGLAAATLITRLVYLASVAHDPFFSYLRHIPDAFFFNNWAQDIVSNGDWLGGDTVFFIGPLYAYFLALVYAVIGPHLNVVRFIHVGLEVGSALFIFGFARRALGEKPARVAGVIWVLYLPAIFFSSFLLPVSLDIFLITGSFYLLARGEKGRGWNVAGAGALLGLAALDRSNLLLFVAAAIPVFLGFMKKLGWRRLLAYFVPIAAIIGVVTLRNGLVGGDFVPVSSQGGINFYLGNSEAATGVYWNLGEVFQGRPEELNKDLATLTAEEYEGRELKPSEVQRWWFRRGLKWLREDPGGAGRLYWRKFRYLTGDYEVSLNVDFYFMKFVSPFHRLQLPWFGFILPFAILGFAVGARRSGFLRTIGAVFIGAYALSVLLFFVSARYRLPMVPVMITFAGAGLVRGYELWRAWRWRAAAAFTAVAMAIGTFSMWPPPDIKRDGAFGQSYYRYGKFFYDQGKYEKAIHYFYKSTTLAPELYQGFVMLGICYERVGQPDTALEMFWHGTLIAPERPQMHFNYGLALARSGRLRAAVASLGRAVELEPSYVEAWVQLGEALIGLRDFARAEVAYRRAVELAPDSARTTYRYAELEYELGRVAEATAWARAAAEADPYLPGPGFLLGRIFSEAGDYPTALKYLIREAEVQPRAPEVFGLLAISFMETGDAERARWAYRSYLALGGQRDPDFESDAGFME